jgi:TolB-like protein
MSGSWRTPRHGFSAVPRNPRALSLRADFLLEGTVRSAGNRVRIVTKLIDAHAETHLWAESYERELGDPFEVQVDVAGRIAHAVVDAMSSAVSH